TAAGEKKREADVEQSQGAGRDARASDHLQRHSADEQVAIGKKAAAEITAEQVQSVIERAEHAHQRRRQFGVQLQMFRRIENQRRIENSEPERGKDLNEKQRGRSLDGGETAF